MSSFWEIFKEDLAGFGREMERQWTGVNPPKKNRRDERIKQRMKQIEKAWKEKYRPEKF
jgi:hypothetical protein